MNGLLCPADFALDLTTPVESTSASFNHFFNLSFVASPTAHEVASIDTNRRLIADASLCAGNAQFEILLAEIGRILVVDEILLGRCFVFGIVRFQLVIVLLASVARCSASVADKDTGRSIETVF